MNTLDHRGPEPLTMSAVYAEVVRARIIFPANDMMLAALVEEVGELAKAFIDHHRQVTNIGDGDSDNLQKEAIQVAAMAIRLLEEGDVSFSYQGLNEE